MLDLPGCIAAGGTREEVMELIKGAIEFHIEGLIEAGEPAPPPPRSANSLRLTPHERSLLPIAYVAGALPAPAGFNRHAY